MSSVGYHEPVEELSDETRDMHRAIVSLMEELEAIDWYQQRADACKDPELRAILAHNRDEEKEHAAMVLEWLRRRDAKLDENLRTYLFSDQPVLEIEGAADAAGSGESGGGEDGSLGIGSLKVGGAK
jgi:ferritin-like protein